MNADTIFVFALIALAAALMASNRVRLDVVSLIVVLALMVRGILSPTEALAGFGSTVVILVAGLLVVGEMLDRSGVARAVGDYILSKGGGSEVRLLALIMLSAGVLGSVMSSAAVVAIFIPIVLRIAAETRLSRSRLLMPMSNATRYPALVRTVWILLAFLVLPDLASADGRVDLLIEDVTVIDPASRSVLPHRSVYIEDGRILAVEPVEESDLEANATISGRKQFLVPGLLDMHVHLSLEETRDDMTPTLELLFANGVTGVRDMAADCWESEQDSSPCIEDLVLLARRIEAGDQVGPRLLSLSSAIVRGESERGLLPTGAQPFFAPGNADEGRQLAAYLGKRDVDLVKIYNSVPREAYLALLHEARQLGLEVSGHLPLGVSVVEASKAGHKTIEHARDLPVACSNYGPKYRETMDRVIERDLSVDPPNAETRLRETLSGYDEELCTAVMETLGANGTYLVPTHGTREMDARAAERSYRNDRRMRYLAPPLRARWQKDLDDTAQVAPLLGELYLDFYELGLRLTAMAHDAGVKVMVGTDANDTMIFPGSGLHDELERLSEAGLGPMDTLRAATTVPAEYLGRADDLGSISPGQLADLLLLRADPLRDIGNTRKIKAVIQGGRVHDRRALEGILRRVELEAKKSAEDPVSRSAP